MSKFYLNFIINYILFTNRQRKKDILKFMDYFDIMHGLSDISIDENESSY